MRNLPWFLSVVEGVLVDINLLIGAVVMGSSVVVMGSSVVVMGSSVVVKGVASSADSWIVSGDG